MKGLLFRLLEDKTGQPGKFFWPVFKPIREELDGFHWCFANQPWMGPPAGFDLDSMCLPFEGVGSTSTMLWRPHTLARYAHTFVAEGIDLWGMIAADDPARLAAQFAATFWRDKDLFIEEHARVWLSHSDRTCWEIYARNERMLRRLRVGSTGAASTRAFDSDSKDRRSAYRAAGLDDVWRNMRG